MMQKRFALQLAPLASIVSMAFSTPALAHVKWFLSRSEEELLRQPKPQLFTQASIFNIVPAILALITIAVSTHLAGRWRGHKLNAVLTAFSERKDAELNLILGFMTGLGFIYCGYSRYLCAPDFIICAHCPQWLPFAEYAIGASLLFGFLARIGGVGLIALLIFTFIKHTVADCLDLLPLYGVGAYFLLVGRSKYSVDAALKIDGETCPEAARLGYFCLRVALGAGFIILGVDEKLVNPQLALDILKYRPELDFVRAQSISQPMFVLCAGLSEVVVGLVLLLGTFPRLAALFVLMIFAGTTLVFGTSELFGHLAYYGILAYVLVRGCGTIPQKSDVRDLFWSTVKGLQQHSRYLPELLR